MHRISSDTAAIVTYTVLALFFGAMLLKGKYKYSTGTLQVGCMSVRAFSRVRAHILFNLAVLILLGNYFWLYSSVRS